jgi:Tfp pilus assembly protein PilO
MNPAVSKNRELGQMTLRIILGIVIIAAAIEIGVFINGYFNQTFAADALTYQIQSSNQNLILLTEKTNALNAEIAENTSQTKQLAETISEAIAYLPSEKTNSTEVIRGLLDLGRQNLVTILPLTIQDWSPAKTANTNYQVLTIALEAKGAEENLTQFIKQVTQLNPTIVIENVTLKISPEAPVGPISSLTDPKPTREIQYTASFTLEMFSK